MTINYAAEATRLLNEYKGWTPAEETIIRTHFQETLEKFFNMEESTLDKLIEAFNMWLDGAPKARLNYWIRKTNTTVEELNIYMTW